MAQTSTTTCVVLLLGCGLLLCDLAKAQLDYIDRSDPDAGKKELETLEKIRKGDMELRTKVVRYWIKDFGCTHPQRAANIMSRMYRMQDQAAADTLHSIMTDANAVVKYAPPTPAQCKEWIAAQEAADKEIADKKAAQAKGKP